jgi:predicted transcriptional regulator
MGENKKYFLGLFNDKIMNAFLTIFDNEGITISELRRKCFLNKNFIDYGYLLTLIRIWENVGLIKTRKNGRVVVILQTKKGKIVCLLIQKIKSLISGGEIDEMD